VGFVFIPILKELFHTVELFSHMVELLPGDRAVLCPYTVAVDRAIAVAGGALPDVLRLIASRPVPDGLDSFIAKLPYNCSCR
jgi:hypothetical protein